jgi:tetratricopeptide (TPR) repeat protein
MNSVATRIANASMILFYTMAYWAVGLTEEEYHIRKAQYWIALGNHRRAIRNYQKSLKSSEDSRVRATMAWCYASIGLMESSREHYRRAFERNKTFDICLGLAYTEMNLENYEECERLIEFVRARTKTPTDQQSAEMAKLQEDLATARTTTSEMA